MLYIEIVMHAANKLHKPFNQIDSNVNPAGLDNVDPR
jgi:hypothetical protein